MLPFVSQVTENKPKYRSIWISGGKDVSNHLIIGCSLSTFHRKKIICKYHLRINSV